MILLSSDDLLSKWEFKVVCVQLDVQNTWHLDSGKSQNFVEVATRGVERWRSSKQRKKRKLSDTILLKQAIFHKQTNFSPSRVSLQIRSLTFRVVKKNVVDEYFFMKCSENEFTSFFFINLNLDWNADRGLRVNFH